MERKRVYEFLMVEGTDRMLLRWVDGALLVDLWPELQMPAAIRRAWAPVVLAASRGRSESITDAYTG